MDFGLSEDQRLFQDALRGYLAGRIPVASVRAIMESESGHDPALVGGLGEQGAIGILIGHEHGGSALGLLDAAIAAEELGRAAAPFSFHSAAVMAPLALALAGSEAQRQRWLPEVAAGTVVLSTVFGAPAATGGALDGSVVFVPDAHSAEAFVVAAGSGPAAELLLVPRDTPGLRVESLETVDATRRVGELVFDGVRVTDDMRMSAAPAAATAERLLDAGRIALGADALGASERALELAVAYALTRRQFGRAIGSFQAVKHMCAETVAEIEPVRSLLWYAAFAWDEQRPGASLMATHLKSHATDVATRALTTCVQVFGGMGFTYECDMHIWFKRAGYDRQLLGGPSELRRRAAALQFGPPAA